jgi:membrane-associated HD superfamily phosphohydrolase
VKAAGGDEDLVDIEQFRYPGPIPQSRETAILMLADGCEARMRAERPKDEDALREMIKDVVDNRTASGQLNGTDLTLHDLDVIVNSFTATLRGIYHPRIEYPKLEKAPPGLDARLAIKTVPVQRASTDVQVQSSTEPPYQAPETSP